MLLWKLSKKVKEVLENLLMKTQEMKLSMLVIKNVLFVN